MTRSACAIAPCRYVWARAIATGTARPCANAAVIAAAKVQPVPCSGAVPRRLASKRCHWLPSNARSASVSPGRCPPLSTTQRGCARPDAGRACPTGARRPRASSLRCAVRAVPSALPLPAGSASLPTPGAAAVRGAPRQRRALKAHRRSWRSSPGPPPGGYWAPSTPVPRPRCRSPRRWRACRF